MRVGSRRSANQPAVFGNRNRTSKPPISSLSSSLTDAAVDFGHVADDSHSEASAGLAGIQPRAAIEHACRVRSSGIPRPSSSISISTISPCSTHRHKHTAAAIFGCILDQIAEHFVQILPFNASGQRLVARHIEPDMRIKPPNRALDRFQARPYFRTAMAVSAPPDSARAGKMVIDLPPHRCGFADHGVRQVVALAPSRCS